MISKTEVLAGIQVLLLQLIQHKNDLATNSPAKPWRNYEFHIQLTHVDLKSVERKVLLIFDISLCLHAARVHMEKIHKNICKLFH